MDKINSIKLIVSDLDGTLLDKHGQLSDINREAIIKLKNNNILFGLATGRPYFSIEPFLDLWGIRDYIDVIIANNGLEVSVKSGPMFISNHISKELVFDILDQYKEMPGNFCLYYEGKLIGQKLDDFMNRVSKKNHIEARVEDLYTTIKHDVEKLLLACDPMDMKTIEDFCLKINDPRYRGFRSQEHLFEFMDIHVNKCAGIQTYCDYAQLTLENVMAFGDNLNDLEMIEGCHIGVVMDNGDEFLKGKADYIAMDHHESGFGKFVLDYLEL